MISATCWVPRGYASEFPEKYELDDEEMERINQMADLNLNDATSNTDPPEVETDPTQDEYMEASQPDSSKLQNQFEGDDDLKEFDMEHYDDDDGNENGAELAMFPGLSSEEVRFHEGEEGEDPYISLPSKEEQSEQKQELQVYPSDNMVLATRTEDDISYLDVYIYDDGAGFHDVDIPQEKGDDEDPDVAKGLVRDNALYIHHDLMLPAFPLCVEWLDYKPGSQCDDPANFAAVGSFDPQIEIWNLDCVEKAFPDMILGEPPQGSSGSLKNKGSKKKKQKNQHVTTHHTGAVLSLAHNREFRAVLASTSADHTVKLWDLNNGTVARSMNSIHSGKNVSSSEWYKTNGSILLTSGYDSRIALSDVRISEESQLSKYWSVSAGEEVEVSTFASENVILSGTDSGNVYAFDIRHNENSKPIWTLNAHDTGISCLCTNNYIPGMMTTSAMGDKAVKLWKFPLELEEKSIDGPNMILSRDFDVGNVLSLSFANDIEVAGNMAIGGISTSLKVYDVFSNNTIRNRFARELSAAQQTAKTEAKQLEKSSRFARKYHGKSQLDNAISVEANDEEDEEEEDDDDDEEDDEGGDGD